MFFLVRTAFWLTLVLALLPTGSAQPSKDAPQVSAVEAVTAAGAAVSDMSGFCERQAEACVVGAQTAVAIGQRAQAGAKMVYEFISEQMSKGETGSVPESKSKPVLVSVPLPMPHPRGSQSTLKPADLAPAWRAPEPRREAQQDRRGKA
jgi:hypothetical protein